MNYFVTTSTSYINFKNYYKSKFCERLPSCECDYKMYVSEYTHFADVDNANLLVHYYAKKSQILLSFFLKLIVIMVILQCYLAG